jgi:hypothetical protein
MSNIINRCKSQIREYYEKAKYQIISIFKGNANVMNKLGNYYYEVEKNYEEAKKYYLMAIDKGNANAMIKLGIYYYEVEQNYEEAKKYLIMGIHNGFSHPNNLVYLDILYYLKKSDNRIFFEKINKNKECVKMNKSNICLSCNYKKNILINFNCNKKYNHYYCHECIDKYYENKTFMCLSCFCEVNTDNIKLEKCDNEIFFQKINENEEYDKIEKSDICLICKCEKDILINFNCNEKHNHYYCHECVNKWYEDNELKCLLCFCEINIKNIKFEKYGYVTV